MNKALILIFLLISFVGNAQEIPNGSFEVWEQEPNGNYEEPGGDWWATMNLLRGFGPLAPVTVNKTSDAAEGQFAAEITSGEFGSFLIPGLLVTGETGDFDISNPTAVLKRGKPFTGSPQKITGSYKYIPANGDSGVVNATLTKFNSSLQKADTIAVAEILFYTTTNSYSLFEAEFNYWQPNIDPDTIIISLVSSAGGQDLQGQIGSKLFIDNLQLSYTQGINMSVFAAIGVSAYPNPFVSEINFSTNSFDENRLVEVYDYQGNLIRSKAFNSNQTAINLTGVAAGTDLYAIRSRKKVIASGSVRKNKND